MAALYLFLGSKKTGIKAVVFLHLLQKKRFIGMFIDFPKDFVFSFLVRLPQLMKTQFSFLQWGAGIRWLILLKFFWYFLTFERISANLFIVHSSWFMRREIGAKLSPFNFFSVAILVCLQLSLIYLLSCNWAHLWLWYDCDAAAGLKLLPQPHHY